MINDNIREYVYKSTILQPNRTKNMHSPYFDHRFYMSTSMVYSRRENTSQLYFILAGECFEWNRPQIISRSEIFRPKKIIFTYL